MKIDIIGSVASGKTTLARKLSWLYKVPYYEKDNIVWKRTPNGDRKRTPEERDSYFNEKTSVRLFRVFKRWIKQRIGKEMYNTKPTLTFLMYNIKWIFEFNTMKKDLLQELNSFGEKVKIFYNSDEAWKFILSTYPIYQRDE